MKRGGAWSSLGQTGTAFKTLPLRLNKLLLLGSVWEKETGAMSAHWELYGVKGNAVFVKTASAAAGQELSLRSAALVKNLNKYFDRPWIREIRRV
ncbi:MAG: DciA family protein [Elusimicrobiales bacterium]|nr:DciA family protein [Elusimicrobiales bacterium]